MGDPREQVGTYTMTKDQFEGYDNQGWLSLQEPPGIPTPRNLNRIADDPMKMSTEHFLLSLGPCHPSMHGVLREVVELNGETIMSSEAHIGYLHRGIEKLCENNPYGHLAPYMDRADYAGGIYSELALAHAAEELGEIEVPERAQWLRALMGEVNRMASHFLWLGPLGLDSGAMAPFLYMLYDRETLEEILESVSGNRITYNYVRPGGVAHDITPDAEAKLRKWLAVADERMQEHWDVLMASEIFQKRVKGIGVVSRDMAMSMGATGFVARASGIDWDLRRDRPYGPYSQLDFNVATATEGDIWARILVRFDEMLNSIKIMRQLLDGMPEGPHMAKMPRVLRLPKGEAYGLVEGCRGEIGVHLYSDGGTNPYRVRYRPPILYHLAIADSTLPGGMLQDAIVSLASFDFCFGEVDR